MSDRTPPARRRRIAGESARPTPAAAAQVGKKVVKKPAGPVRSKVAEAADRATAAKPATPVAPSMSSNRDRVQRPPVLSRPTVSVSIPRPRPRSTGTVRDVVVLVTALLVLAAGVTTAALGFRHWQGDSFSDAQDAAVASAGAATESILSYRYDQLDRHEKNAQKVMTASYFNNEYEAKTLPALQQVAPQRKVTVAADVRNAAAVPCGERCSADAASVLVFVDVDRRIEGEDQATVSSGRLRVDMVRVDGDWKVSNITGL